MPPVLAATTENSNGYLFGLLQALRRWIRSLRSSRSRRYSDRAVQVIRASSGGRQQQQQQQPEEQQQQQQQGTTEDWLIQAGERQPQRVSELLLDSGSALHIQREDLWVVQEQQGAWSLPQ